MFLSEIFKTLGLGKLVELIGSFARALAKCLHTCVFLNTRAKIASKHHVQQCALVAYGLIH